jgi:hypothetical protein
LTKSAWRGEASATRRGVVSGPQATVLGKKHVELFLFCTIARVLFYECSPYLNQGCPLLHNQSQILLSQHPYGLSQVHAQEAQRYVKIYDLEKIAAPNGIIYVKIQKGMYGLPQAGILAQNLLKEGLNKHGYHQNRTTPGLWQHDWRPISFTLCVDGFGIKYVGKEHANHLAKTLNEHYVCSIAWTGTRYIGMKMDWDYAQRQVHVSMLDYTPKALTRFRHHKPCTPQHQPYPHVKPNYGAKAQYTESGGTSPALPKEGKKFIQEVIGTFLCYARCVDSTMLAAIESLATQQANPTKNTMAKVTQFLDYATTHPNAILTYHASNMVLAGHSNASNLSESNGCNRAGGHFFMSNNTAKPPNNGIFSLLRKLSKQSCHWRRRPKWALSTSTVGKLSQLAKPSISWGILNLQHQCKQTTLQHLALSTTTSSKN